MEVPEIELGGSRDYMVVVVSCIKGLLVVFRGYFVGILQVIGEYFDCIKNWILSVEYLYL